MKGSIGGKLSAGEALAQKNNRKSHRRQIAAIVSAVVVVGLAAAAIAAVYSINTNNNIQMAQNLLSQFDINTTYREAEYASEDDDDGDGISNAVESRNGTNRLDEDSDNDGLNDGDEDKLGTNPLSEDTDGDGLLDGFELICGLDPKKSSTDGENNDADVTVSYRKVCEEMTLDVTGSANIADVSISELDLFGIVSNMGVVSEAYDITSDYSFETAQITFAMDEEEMERKGAGYDNISVLKFDPESQSYESVESKTDSSSGTITAEISEYGSYVVGMENTVNEEAVTRIAFLLDNSGSMYPVELCYVSPENDVEFKRLDLTESLIEKIDGNGDYFYSVAKFTGTYTLMQSFTEDTSKVFDALDEIRESDEIFDGSHIETALSECMATFDSGDTNTRNIIVLLSDGASDEENAESIESLAQTAVENNIIILTIGLGREADRMWLRDISALTGGKYYSASDADALEGVYEQIVTTLNYDMVDYSDSDETKTGYSLYNTGFDPIKNGFSFRNFRTSDTPSLDYGMAMFARDWYVGTLPMSLDSLSPADESDQKYDADGYDLTGTSIEELFESHGVLANILPGMMLGDYADVTKYLDYKSSGNVLKVDEDMLSDALAQGWSADKYDLASSNLKWTQVQLLSLDLTGSADKIEEYAGNDELQLYKALYRLNAIQWNDSEDIFTLYDGDEGFERLKNLLALGEPALMTIDGSHTVNVIALIQDSDDHRKFVLQVYDSNYPGTTKKLYISRSVLGEFTIEDGEATVDGVTYEYTCEYEGKQVGVEFSGAAAS